jgi:hypothetical protein
VPVLFTKNLILKDFKGNSIQVNFLSDKQKHIESIDESFLSFEINGKDESLMIQDQSDKFNQPLKEPVDFVKITIVKINSQEKFESIKIKFNKNNDKLDARWREEVKSWIVGGLFQFLRVQVSLYTETDTDCSEQWEMRRHRVNFSTGSILQSATGLTGKWIETTTQQAQYTIPSSLVPSGWNSTSYRWDEDGWGCDIDEVDRQVVFYSN